MVQETGQKIGVLALQGAFREHIQILRTLGVHAVEVRKPDELTDLDGLVIPGGESTSMALIAERWGMVEPLRQWVQAQKPTWGTCAGMILLAERATNQKLGGQALIGGLDVTVNRNYFGRQVDSFETVLSVPALGEDPIPAVFIRAPAITEIGDDVEVLARLPGNNHGNNYGDNYEDNYGNNQEKVNDDMVAVAVRSGPILATAFHPELTRDPRWHLLFLQMVSAQPKVEA